MKKTYIVLLLWLSMSLQVFAAASATQTAIGDVSGNNTVIPNNVIDSYNANNAWTDLSYGTTVGSAYEAGLLSDGNDGPITSYVSGLWNAGGWAGGCSYGGGSIASELDGCLNGSNLVNPGDGLIESGIKQKIVYWTSQISGLLGLLAVGAIVYGGLMMTISWGDDEKIKKWKDIVKWALIGFLALIAASGIVRVIVEVMFSVAS